MGQVPNVVVLLQTRCAKQAIVEASGNQSPVCEGAFDQFSLPGKRREQPFRGIAINLLQILLILITGVFQGLDNDRHGAFLSGTRTDDRKKVISVWFFCHVQMVTFARSSVLLRLNVAPSR